MPRVRRSRVVAARREAVWKLVSDARARPRWWPGVERVEDATDAAWTEVLRSSRGKAVRADFTRTDIEPREALAWRQELDESPFERFMSDATTRISLAAADGGRTRVELEAVRRLRGLARLGGVMVRRATRRQLDDALSALEEAVAGDRSGTD